MRKERFDESECQTEADVLKLAPWAARVLRVEGGWVAYESITDYETAVKQV